MDGGLGREVELLEHLWRDGQYGVGLPEGISRLVSVLIHAELVGHPIGRLMRLTRKASIGEM